MATFLFTFLFLLLVVGAMAIGAIFASKPIKGSCGGIQALGLGGSCDICGGDPEACDEEAGRPGEVKAMGAEHPFYDASK